MVFVWLVGEVGDVWRRIMAVEQRQRMDGWMAGWLAGWLDKEAIFALFEGGGYMYFSLLIKKNISFFHSSLKLNFTIKWGHFSK